MINHCGTKLGQPRHTVGPLGKHLSSFWALFSHVSHIVPQIASYLLEVSETLSNVNVARNMV